MLSYQLYALSATNRDEYRRTITNDVVGNWTLYGQDVAGNYNFTKLNVPYDDELMAGITQNLFMFSMSLKYIHRAGKDGIMRENRGTTQSADYWWTNNGESNSDIVSLSITNDRVIETYGVKHYYLLALDYTNVKRNYNGYTDSTLDNEWISYNGVLMRYADRPADNFIRPFSLRFNTTHTFNIWRTRWIWNNFFRFRSGYDAMTTTNTQNQDSFEIDGVLTKVTTYRPFRIQNAFNWDMRIGFEIDVWNKNTLYVNLDIYNVLNNQNMAVYNFSGSVGTTTFAAVPIYEIGWQFWLQVGYKF
ncbi:hypothetical protein DCO58_02340 [Helicobacter saguini]|uniref:TonB-dependent receptor-like beta-barrel domain-containing protein n=1 Tax=Helicobacter saguini TaxID=1548018 RepID=A0A347VRT4_9HELI|nr:hypothetical protein [Helicobacter saguini]MWV62784.1 hypothetical protein [Helicobacter saguini]MWV66546.1 hypothetical protein [Helicobacter saguini]MWV68896.1 hypothetical protein [Helicobacter saguini]MWV71550.1 hypothetical protein [Helicobacter saguini]TLD93644.1 hypothetical protein LS64_008435 [Helicobacter saguini]